MGEHDNYRLPDKDYVIELVIRAESWDEAVRIMKSELGITEKRNSADRQINNLYFVSCELRPRHLTKEFYANIRESENISIISDQASSTLRELVLNIIEPIEIQLRRLLLHVSDIVDNYYQLFKTSPTAKNKAASQNSILKQDADPIVGHLTLEDILVILGYDQSWEDKRNTPDSLDVLRMISSTENIDDLKKHIKRKLQHETVWDVIAFNVLKVNISWEDVKEDLYQLKSLRNKAAHLRVLTMNDFHQAKVISGHILPKIEKQRRINATQKQSLDNLNQVMTGILQEITNGAYKGMAESMQSIANTHSNQISDLVKNIPASLIEEQIKDIDRSFSNIHKPELLLKSKGFELPDGVIGDEEDKAKGKARGKTAVSQEGLDEAEENKK